MQSYFRGKSCKASGSGFHLKGSCLGVLPNDEMIYNGNHAFGRDWQTRSMFKIASQKHTVKGNPDSKTRLQSTFQNVRLKREPNAFTIVNVALGHTWCDPDLIAVWQVVTVGDPSSEMLLRYSADAKKYLFACQIFWSATVVVPEVNLLWPGVTELLKLKMFCFQLLHNNMRILMQAWCDETNEAPN